MWDNLDPGNSSPLAKTSGHLVQHLPQVFVYHDPLINHILSLYMEPTMSNYVFFYKDQDCCGEFYQSHWGCHNIYLLLEQLHVICITQGNWSPFTPQKEWGNVDKFHNDITFLLVLPEEGAEEERTYGLTMVWVHPYQVRVSTLEETIKQLDQLTLSGPNWPYALV